MKKYRKWLYTALLLIFSLCLCGGSGNASVTEIPLGDDLPVWRLDGVHTAAELPDNAQERGLIGIYTTDTDRADVYVYRFSRENGVSLEEFGMQQAAERGVFCNMLTDRNVPTAVLNYHECMEGNHYIVQAYIYDAGADFVEVCTLFKTEPVSFGSGGLSIRMIREYDAQEQNESPLNVGTAYFTENDRLPLLRIRQFSKQDFPAEIVEPDLLNTVSEEQYAALAEDGWTLEEIVLLYDESYDLLRGDVMCRNDLTLAFIGYIDGGIFKTRAVVDDGTEYIMLCAEAEAARFQHVTNALIDSIEKDGSDI